jgi:mannose-6-phosphate isomerase-like protein (cupin superfamily)
MTNESESAQPLVLRADDIEPFIHPGDSGYASQHVLGREAMGGGHDLLLNRGTVAPNYALGGGNHPDNDEIYYAVSGQCMVDLGGDPNSGEGSETFRLEEGMVAFIPKGTFHRLRNETDRPFVLLTIWPQPAERGANGIHDLRLDTWGTGFRLREGRAVERDTATARVTDATAGWDPLETS